MYKASAHSLMSVDDTTFQKYYTMGVEGGQWWANTLSPTSITNWTLPPATPTDAGTEENKVVLQNLSPTFSTFGKRQGKRVAVQMKNLG